MMLELQVGRHDVFVGWLEQTAAEFGRRAHAKLGRGFVIIDAKDRFIYVTLLSGAPVELMGQVCMYAPYEETVVVFEDAEEPGVLIIRRIRIETRQ